MVNCKGCGVNNRLEYKILYQYLPGKIEEAHDEAHLR